MITGTIFMNTSCSTYYGKGISGSEYKPLQHPWSEGDESVSQHNLSGAIAKPYAFRSGDKNTMGSLTYYKSGVKKGLVWGAGLTMHAGQYDVNSISEFGNISSLSHDLKTGSYSYIGGGFRGKIGFESKPFEKLRWEMIGLQMDAIYEGGEFAKFREDANAARQLLFNPISFAIGNRQRMRMLSTLTSKIKWKMGKSAIGTFGIGFNYVYQEFDLRMLTDFGIQFGPVSLNASMALSDLSSFSFLGVNPRIGGQLSANYAFGINGSAVKRKRK